MSDAIFCRPRLFVSISMIRSSGAPFHNTHLPRSDNRSKKHAPPKRKKFHTTVPLNHHQPTRPRCVLIGGKPPQSFSFSTSPPLKPKRNPTHLLRPHILWLQQLPIQFPTKLALHVFPDRLVLALQPIWLR